MLSALSRSSVFGLWTFFLAAHLAFTANAAPWSVVTLADPRSVELEGPAGAAFQRGVQRLALPPYSTDWLLADVSFKLNRIFTNYSGDVSGRFLELAALTSPPGSCSPSTLAPALDQITRFQKPDGHFGLEMDFSQPMQRLSPPIPMLWGNARLLVGLVAAAEQYHRPDLLAAARRLGDFYVATADVFCAPAREAELRATGTGGDGYTCCYFPAIEGLALLYRSTHEDRYLQQARRMAEWFWKFDALPTDHSHGNLCAWRGILELYDLTGNPSYLDRARDKWQAAMQKGFVWPLGGVGEHWYVFHIGDEGCSESDWLRFNLQLWRFTGEPRYLEVAERLLQNQYPANQCANGGYGWRHFDGDAAGPIATRGTVNEWNFCCSFHGPLGLHFLKAYLAAGSDRGLWVNFPVDFTASLKHRKRDWRVALRSIASGRRGEHAFELELAPLGTTKAVRTALWLRRPQWATQVSLSDPAGAAIPFKLESGYLHLNRKFRAGQPIRVIFHSELRAEERRFQPAQLSASQVTRLRDVSLLDGPQVLFATPTPAAGRLTLLARQNGSGKLELWPAPQQGAWLTIALPSLETQPDQIASLLTSATPVLLRPESALGTRRRAAFAHDVVVVPAQQLPAAAVADFVKRAPAALTAQASPVFGEKLEHKPDAWIAPPGWAFTANGLLVSGGDIGLIDGEGYADYLFEFDLELPLAGQGIAGWVVRAQSPDDCIHFQLQSADSPFVAPQYKTRPNTLRPHQRRAGEWSISEPVLLPKEVRRGQTYHVAVECRGAQVTVFLDGEKIFTQEVPFTSGAVGFRAAGPVEQGRFRNISLRQL